MEYSKKHIWIKQKEGEFEVGLSSYAVNKLGNIVFLNLPDEEDDIVIDEAFGDVESVKTVSDLISPVSGRVTAINEDLLDDPSDLMENAEDMWLLKVTDVEKTVELMTEEQYRKYVETL